MLRDLDWALDEGTLYIDGEGDMEDFKQGENTSLPWNEVKNEVVSIVIGQGILSVGAWSFAEYPELKEVVFQKGFERIHHHAFWGCEKLETVTLPAGVSLKSTLELDGTGAEAKKNAANTILFGMGSFFKTPYAEKTFGDYYIRKRVLYEVYSTASELVIPSMVTEIKSFAFDNVSPEKVTIPDRIEEINMPWYPFLPVRVKKAAEPEVVEKPKKKRTTRKKAEQ